MRKDDKYLSQSAKEALIFQKDMSQHTQPQENATKEERWSLGIDCCGSMDDC